MSYLTEYMWINISGSKIIMNGHNAASNRKVFCAKCILHLQCRFRPAFACCYRRNCYRKCLRHLHYRKCFWHMYCRMRTAINNCPNLIFGTKCLRHVNSQKRTAILNQSFAQFWTNSSPETDSNFEPILSASVFVWLQAATIDDCPNSSLAPNAFSIFMFPCNGYVSANCALGIFGPKCSTSVQT